MSPDQLTALLNTELGESLAGKVPGEQVTQLERLSGGANNETWRLMWGSTSLILRRHWVSGVSLSGRRQMKKCGGHLAKWSIY